VKSNEFAEGQISAADHALPKVPPMIVYRIASIYNSTFVASPFSPCRHHAAARFSGVSTPLASARIIQVDGEYEPGRLLNRQVGRLGAVEDFADIDANLTVVSRKKNLRGFQIVNPTQKNQSGRVYFSML
jgi:hypothetical protein